MNRKRLSCCAILVFAMAATSASAQDPNYILTVESTQVAPGGTTSLDTSIDSTAGQAMQGWSYGICHDSAALQLDSMDNGALSLTVNEGDLPDFNEQSLLADGYPVGVVICLTGCASLPPTTGVLTIGNYTNLMPEGQTTTLSVCGSLGMPPVAAVVVVGGASIVATTTDGLVESFLPPITAHVRGDANADATLNIADGVWMLNDLFQGGLHTDCDSANDANSDGSYDASDAVFVFNHQFLNGPQPAAPYPDCGFAAEQAPEDCLDSGCP